MNRPNHPMLPLALVLGTIVLQLIAAWVLSTVASIRPSPSLLMAGSAVAAAIGLNIFRFGLWGYAHKRYPLSHTYPLTALFFPCVLLLSVAQGNTITAAQIVGTMLIAAGAVLMSSKSRGKG